MKRSIFNVSLIAAGMLAFASCSSDDELLGEDLEAPSVEEGTRNSGENLETKTYSQESLILTYNGNILLGKTSTFTLTKPGEATIELAGEPLDLSAFGGESGMTLPVINTCGVFPGTPKYTLSVELTGTEDECAFKGASETDFCTFSYEGTVNAEVMTLNLTDVKLKDTTMAGSSEQLAGMWGFKPFESNFFNDLRVVWESEKQVEIAEGFEMPIGTIVSLALSMPIVDGVAIPDLLTGAVKSITFLEDGNIVASYIDAASESGVPVTSPTNIAQYVVMGDKLMFYLNPQAIIAREMKGDEGTRSEDPFTDALNSIFAAVIPMASEGIPLSYGTAISYADSFTGEVTYFDYPATMSVYLGTEVLKPLLQAVAPLLENEEIKNLIITAATSNPDFADMAPMVEGMLNSLPEVIEKTSVIEIGVNLERQDPNSVPVVTVD